MEFGPECVTKGLALLAGTPTTAACEGADDSMALSASAMNVSSSCPAQ